MKQLFAAAAILAAGLLLEAGGANAAQASLSGSLGIGSDSPWADAIQEVHHKKHKHKKHKKHWKHKHKKHWKHKHKHKKHWGHHKHHNGGFFLNFGSHGPVIRYEQPYDQYARKCHNVVTDGYFHGRYAKIGGTMCYDHAGNGYIVDGSRYLIKYY